MKKGEKGSLMKEKLFLENLVSLCPDGIIAINRVGTIIVFNQAAEAITGYRREETLGRLTISDLYHTKEMARQIKKIMYSLEYGGPGRLKDFEVDVVTKAGEKVPIRLSATLMWERGKEAGSVGFFHDLTAKRQMESRLQELSITDSLTALHNHRHFYSVLNDEMQRTERYRRSLSLICIDIDNFKQCNDHFGHLEGDQVLRLVGDIVRTALRRTDRGFRYGGDEFMVLLPETMLSNATLVAQKIRTEFASRCPHSHPGGQKGRKLKRVTLSLGVAQLGRGEAAESFIKRADLAMYEAKRDGGDQIRKAERLIGKAVKTQGKGLGRGKKARAT